MIYRYADPIEDSYAYERDRSNSEDLYPECDCCGCRITEKTYFWIGYGKKGINVCNHCLEERYTEEYVEEMKNGSEI